MIEMNDDEKRVITRNYITDNWEVLVIQLNKIGIQRVTEEIKHYECFLVNNVEHILEQPEAIVIKRSICKFQQLQDAMDRGGFSDTHFASITRDTTSEEQIFDIILRINKRK